MQWAEQILVDNDQSFIEIDLFSGVMVKTLSE